MPHTNAFCLRQHGTCHFIVFLFALVERKKKHKEDEALLRKITSWLHCGEVRDVEVAARTTDADPRTHIKAGLGLALVFVEWIGTRFAASGVVCWPALF